jgi:short-subunit dehydrogenase
VTKAADEPLAHAIVTGAAGAIGAAIARAVRREWPGTRLALVDRAPCDALATELGNAGAYAADLRAIEQLPALVEEIERAAPIEGLVNCAGVMHVRTVHAWDWEAARDLLAVDLLAPLRLQDLVVRGMVERRRGAIVNVASMAGRVALRGCAYYGASKAGLAMASEIARADLAPHGIRVVTVYPGPVRSPLEAGARADYGGGGWFGRLAPTGDPVVLADAIVDALRRNRPRVIYPKLYGLGWAATNAARRFALAYGPPPSA